MGGTLTAGWPRGPRRGFEAPITAQGARGDGAPRNSPRSSGTADGPEPARGSERASWVGGERASRSASSRRSHALSEASDKSPWISRYRTGPRVGPRHRREAGKAAAPAGASDKDAKVELKTVKEKTSYTFSINIGKSFKNQSIDIDLPLVMKGIQDAMGGGKCLLTDAECTQVMQEFQKEMVAKRSEGKKAAGDKNKRTETCSWPRAGSSRVQTFERTKYR
jgi:hypothetical protein